MPVTKARKLNIKPEDTASATGQGKRYDSIEVPADYELVCSDVNEYPKEGKPKGWRLEYDLDGLNFSYWLPFSEAARWKIVKTFEAHGIPLEEGVASVDPNILIDTAVGAHIDLDDDAEYREIKYLFSLANIVEDEPVVEDVEFDEEEDDELEVL